MTDSDSAQPQPECAVCPNKGLLRCTGCRPESTQRFCSRECMKLIWPGHKGICGKDPSAVYFPPLDADEQAFLRANEKLPVDMISVSEQVPLLELARLRGLWTGGFEDLVTNLGQADCTISEPSRSRLIALCRVHFARTVSDIARKQDKPWPIIAEDHLCITDLNQLSDADLPAGATEDLSRHDYNPFKELAEVYHQLVILDTLLSRVTPTRPPAAPSGLKRAMLEISVDRLCAAILDADLLFPHAFTLSVMLKSALKPVIDFAKQACKE
ncbi:hypothetical protein JCM10207_001239 [Rhodosporidiobolus poonsookiae]